MFQAFCLHALVSLLTAAHPHYKPLSDQIGIALHINSAFQMV